MQITPRFRPAFHFARIPDFLAFSCYASQVTPLISCGVLQTGQHFTLRVCRTFPALLPMLRRPHAPLPSSVLEFCRLYRALDAPSSSLLCDSVRFFNLLCRASAALATSVLILQTRREQRTVMPQLLCAVLGLPSHEVISGGKNRSDLPLSPRLVLSRNQARVVRGRK